MAAKGGQGECHQISYQQNISCYSYLGETLTLGPLFGRVAHFPVAGKGQNVKALVDDWSSKLKLFTFIHQQATIVIWGR